MPTYNLIEYGDNYSKDQKVYGNIMPLSTMGLPAFQQACSQLLKKIHNWVSKLKSKFS